MLDTSTITDDETGEVTAPGWKNMAFAKDGRSYLGPRIWPSKEIAAGKIGRLERAMALGEIDGIDNMKGFIRADDYSHAIQIPWCKQ